jgi:hypothetical protein
MVRPTRDPKPVSLTVRISADDDDALRGLMKATDSSAGEVIRRLIRLAASNMRRNVGPPQPPRRR